MQRSGQTAKTQKLRQIPWKPTALTSAKLREKQNAPMRKTPSGQRLIKPGGGRGVNSGGGAAPRPAAPDGGIPGARTADGTLSAFAPRALRNGTATLRGTSESFSGRGTCRQHPTHTPARRRLTPPLRQRDTAPASPGGTPGRQGGRERGRGRG